MSEIMPVILLGNYGVALPQGRRDVHAQLQAKSRSSGLKGIICEHGKSITS